MSSKSTLVAATRALRLADTPPRGTVLGRAFAEVVARLPDVRADHQPSDEIRIAELLLDDLATR